MSWRISSTLVGNLEQGKMEVLPRFLKDPMGPFHLIHLSHRGSRLLWKPSAKKNSNVASVNIVKPA